MKKEELIKTLKDFTKKGAEKLKEQNIPDKLKKLSQKGVEKLKEKDIPEKLKTVTKKGVEKLKEQNIPDKLKTLSKKGAEKLKEKDIPNKLKKLSQKGVEKLKEQNIPEKLKELSQKGIEKLKENDSENPEDRKKKIFLASVFALFFISIIFFYANKDVIYYELGDTIKKVENYASSQKQSSSNTNTTTTKIQSKTARAFEENVWCGEHYASVNVSLEGRGLVYRPAIYVSVGDIEAGGSRQFCGSNGDTPVALFFSDKNAEEKWIEISENSGPYSRARVKGEIKAGRIDGYRAFWINDPEIIQIGY